MDDVKFASPQTVDSAVNLLSEHGQDAALISGGQSLLPMMRQRLADFDILIDINDIDGMDYIEKDGGRIKIGCLVRHADVAKSELVETDCTMLAEGSRSIGDVQVRNRGTLCGAVAHADPAGDPPVIATTLNAEIKSQGDDGEQTYDAETFFQGFFETQLENTEIVTEVSFPTVDQPCGAAYEKYEPSAGAYPVATVGVFVELENGIVIDANIVTGAIEHKPMVMTEPIDLLLGTDPKEGDLNEIAEVTGRNSEPMEDADGGVDFKKEITKTLTKRAGKTAIQRAGGSIQ
jgi:carbon-monoxide dehydrogenase medium subunit